MLDNANVSTVTGYTLVNTANPNRDGTGTLFEVLTAANNGVIINSVTIKAQDSTSEGMVRLFIGAGAETKYLLEEFNVPSTCLNGAIASFSATIPFPSGFSLASGESLFASSETGDLFNVFAEGIEWTYSL